MQSFLHYYDQLEQHLPFKPSKWDRKYQIALLCVGGIFFIMAIVAFALHDHVPKPLFLKLMLDYKLSCSACAESR